MRRRRVSGPSGKPIGWRGTSYRDLCAFPADARREAGYQLFLLHAFTKKSRKTSARDIALARQRYQQLVTERGGQ